MYKNEETYSELTFQCCFSLVVVVHLNRSGDDQEVLFDQILMGQVDFPSPYWDNVSDSAKVGFQCLLLPYSLCTLMELLILTRLMQGDLMILLI